MIRYENNCVGCDWCCNCGADHYAVLICDECGEEVPTLYEYDGEQMCETCVLKFLPEVEVD